MKNRFSHNKSSIIQIDFRKILITWVIQENIVWHQSTIIEATSEAVYLWHSFLCCYMSHRRDHCTSSGVNAESQCLLASTVTHILDIIKSMYHYHHIRASPNKNLIQMCWKTATNEWVVHQFERFIKHNCLITCLLFL